VKGEKGSTIITIHHTWAMLGSTDTNEGILIMLIIRTIQMKQTPVGLRTQRHHILRTQIFDMVKGEKDSH
jgi:hypothetical protein